MKLKTAEQLRQARAALHWTQAELAERAHCSVPTVKRLESMNGMLAIRLSTLFCIENAFETEGILFLEDGDSAVGAGVSWKPRKAD